MFRVWVGRSGGDGFFGEVHEGERAGAALGKLDGAPASIKDNVDMAGFPTRSGSTTTPETPAVADAPVVARLRAAAWI